VTQQSAASVLLPLVGSACEAVGSGVELSSPSSLLFMHLGSSCCLVFLLFGPYRPLIAHLIRQVILDGKDWIVIGVVGH
jgi:hypothetical protein